MSRLTDARLRELLKMATGQSLPDPADAPRFTQAQVDWLERAYPPRCYDPALETVEEHLHYGGRAGLVQDLKAILAAQGDPDAQDDDDRYPSEAPTDWDDAERAGGPN